MLFRSTNNVHASREANKILTSNNNAKFKISLERKLEKRYSFKDLEKREMKEFNSFIESTVGNDLTFQQVHELFGTKRDNNDKVDGMDIIHYRVNNKYRIHGYLRDSYFVLCRIDPNHNVHNK